MAEHRSILSISDGMPLAAIARLTDLLGSVAGMPFARDIPLIGPALLLGHPALAEIASQMTPPEGAAVVHESQSFVAANPMPLGASLRVEAKLTAKDMVRLFDFEMLGEGDAALGSMLTRLRFVSPEDMARLKGSRFPPHMDKGNVVWRQSNGFSASAVAEYLDLANDPNPIHTSNHAARAVGLEGAVIPGMFIAGVAETMLLDVLGTVTPCGLKLRFMAPVPVGQELRFGALTRARDAAGFPKTARVFALRPDETIAAIGDFDLRCDQAAM